MEVSFELQIRKNNDNVYNDNDNKWNPQITVAIMTYNNWRNFVFLENQDAQLSLK